MNTTVRTRRSGRGTATPGGSSPRPARLAPGMAKTSRAPRPAPPASGAQVAGRPAGTLPASGAQVAGRPAGTPAPAAVQRHASRTPFVVLVIGLLAGGLVCLLVINTTLAAGSYQISRLQQDNAAGSQQLQQLQQQVAAEDSPASIQQRALRLGMRPQPVLNFVDLQNGRRYSTAAHLPSLYNVPGYTP